MLNAVEPATADSILTSPGAVESPRNRDHVQPHGGAPAMRRWLLACRIIGCRRIDRAHEHAYPRKDERSITRELTDAE
jgi:hypothetical protein